MFLFCYYSRFISQLSAVGTRILCDNIPGLVGRQRQLCRTYPDVMVSIGRGVRLGVNECQYQFRNNRWNCSTLDRDSTVFGKVMLKSKFWVILHPVQYIKKVRSYTVETVWLSDYRNTFLKRFLKNDTNSINCR